MVEVTTMEASADRLTVAFAEIAAAVMTELSADRLAVAVVDTAAVDATTTSAFFAATIPTAMERTPVTVDMLESAFAPIPIGIEPLANILARPSARVMWPWNVGWIASASLGRLSMS